MNRLGLIFAVLLWATHAIVAQPCAAAQAPPPRSLAEVQAILSAAPAAPPEDSLPELNVVLLAGKKDHGPHEHDYPLWQKRWKVLLGGKQTADEAKVNLYGPAPAGEPDETFAGSPKVTVSNAWEWPNHEQFAAADLIVMFSAPDWTPEHLDQVRAFVARGGGFVVTHMAIWQSSKELADLLGLAKQDQTRFRHGPLLLKITAPDHPICLGLPREISFFDESYFNFQGDASKVQVLATSDEMVEGRDSAEPMFWTREVGQGRIYVCIPGHFDWTFDDPLFRLLLLRGMAWAAGGSPYRFDELVLRGAPTKETAVSPSAIPVTAPAGVTPREPDPKDPHLLLWLDASQSATLTIDTDGHISSWASRGAKPGHHLASAESQRPKYVAKSLGGRPAVTFDGADDVLRNTRFDQSVQDWTVALVVTPRSNSGWFRGFLSGNKQGQNDFITGFNLDMGGDATLDFSCVNLEGAEDRPGMRNLRTDSAPFATGQVIMLSTGRSRSQLYVNGQAEGDSPAGPGICSLQELRLGARFHAGKEQGFLDGEVSEVLLYGKELRDTERDALFAYLVEKYAPDIKRYGYFSLDDAFRALPVYDWSASRRPLAPIDEAIASSHSDAATREALQTRLAAVLSSDATPAAKDFVCRRLARIGTNRSVAPLSNLLADARFATMARFALEGIPGAESLAALREALSSATGPARIGLIHALGNRRDAEAAKMLAALLEDPDPAVAAAAARSLGQIGSASSVPALSDLRATAAEPLKAVATESLINIGFQMLEQNKADDAAQVFQALEDPAAQIRAATLSGLVRACPAEAPDQLIAALRSDIPRFHSVARHMIQAAANEELLEVLLFRLPQLPPDGKVALLDAVSGSEHPAIRPAAVAALNDGQTEVRIAALEALATAGTAEEIPALLDRATSAPTDAERAAAITALNRMPGARVEAGMLDALKTVDASSRVLLVRSLAARRAEVPLAILSPLTKDPVEAVRIEAAEAMPVLAGPQAAGDLIRLLVTARSTAERAVAERALLQACRQIADPAQQAGPILAALDEATPTQRAFLLPLLGTLGGAEAERAIRAAMQDPSELVRDAAVQALANWPDATVIDQLLQIARRPDKEAHRISAVRGIARVAPRPGQLPPEGAFDVLQQAFELATRPQDRKLILARMSAVRTPQCLAFTSARIDDVSLQAEALTATADLAEGMKASHPRQARAAFEKVLAVTQDQPLRARIEQLLSKMDL